MEATGFSIVSQAWFLNKKYAFMPTTMSPNNLHFVPKITPNLNIVVTSRSSSSCRSSKDDSLADENHETNSSLDLHAVMEDLNRLDEKLVDHLLRRVSYEPFNFQEIYYPHFEDGTSVLGAFVKITEKEFAEYTDELHHPFFPREKKPDVPKVLHEPASCFNINPKIWDGYIHLVLPKLAEIGNVGHSTNVAAVDYDCLQALSRRIHFGKFIAEAKYQSSPTLYTPCIQAQDEQKLKDLVTDKVVEEAVKARITSMAEDVVIEFGDKVLKRITPSDVASVYETWIIPLTKEVEVEYLLKRIE